jgi:D-amino-acid oxidase
VLEPIIDFQPRLLRIDTPAYLDYLAGRFRELGGQLHRAKIASLSDVTQELQLEHPPTVIVNCTGLGSLILADVQDDALYPTRGQLCVILAPWIKYGKTFTGKGTTSYTIPRSSGLVVVGGTRDYDDW